MAVGVALKEDVIVHNAATYVWNYNQELLRSQEWAPLVPTLEKVVEALKQCDQPTLKADVQLLKLVCAVGGALAAALEAGDPKSPAAVDVCKWASELADGRPRLKKGVTAVWARVQAAGGAKEPVVGAEPESGALALLELLAADLIDGEPARAAALAKAKELLKADSDGAARPEPELWCRAARQSLALGELLGVVESCEAALTPLVNAPAGSSPLKDEWKWYALAECTHGEAIEKLLKPGQQPTLREQLHAQAAAHLATSMTYANRAAEPLLVVAAAQRFWRHCGPLVASPRRALLREPASAALGELEAIADAEQRAKVVPLQVKLYEAVLAILSDGKEWAPGVKLLDRAFASLPESAHESLWEQKVVFMCRRGGKGIAGEMYKMKDFAPSIQARVWAVLGSNSENKKEQLNALMRAVEALSATPLQKVEHLVTLGEWLYCSGYPLADAEDQLMAAIDLLMDCEEVPDDDGDDGGASTVMSQSDLASVAGGSDAGGGRGGGDSAPPTRQSARSSSRRSSVSSAGSTAASGKGKEDDVTLNVHHFEQLVRIYLMRAKMAATTAAKTEFCLVAHHYMERIWQLAAATAIAKAAADAAEADEDAADADAAAAKAEAAAKADPAYALPRALHNWAGWAPSQTLRDAMKAIATENVISAAALPTAQLTAFYLEYAAECLHDAGMDLHALLPLSLLRVVASDVLEDATLAQISALRTAHALQRLALPELAAAARADAGALRPSAAQKHEATLQLRQLQQAAEVAAPAAAPAAAARRRNAGGGAAARRRGGGSRRRGRRRCSASSSPRCCATKASGRRRASGSGSRSR